jgi:Tol biopolymer transport system component
VNRAQRVEILQLPESTGSRIYISPDGLGIAYFIEAGEGVQPGLYMADLESGVSGRVLPVDSLVQRGFVSEPVWSADGEQMALMLATEYATDIFLLSRSALGEFTNITNSGAYDLFPAFSPDGRFLAFVSDRARCPTWIPEQPGTCDRTGTPPPDGGQLHVQDLETGEVTRLSDVWITPSNAPRWINNRQIAFAEGDPLSGDTTRTLWLANAITGQAREVRPAGVQNPLMLNEAWSPDGTQVLYQSAGTSTEIQLANASGDVLASLSDLNYPRYGVSASWSPSGEFIAIGGVNGQCPYGATVLDDTLAFIAQSNPPPSMCSPAYAPNGAFVAYTGISLNNFDGRADIYTANPNGFGSVNLTGDMRGTMTFLRWISTPDDTE